MTKNNQKQIHSQYLESFTKNINQQITMNKSISIRVKANYVHTNI